MSKHIITKSKMIVDGYVDAAGIGRRVFILLGSPCLFKLKEKRAEVIVVVSNEPVPLRNNTGGLTRQRRTERIIVSNSVRRRASLILNEKQITTGVKSGCNYDFPNRRIRDPYVRWCERRTSSLTSGEAVYSIMCSFIHASPV